MNPPSALSGAHLRTYDAIFHHPVSHHLSWHDVLALFRQLGEVHEEPNGNLKVTVNHQILVLPPPRTKDISDPAEIVKLRHFLERSGPSAPAGPQADGRCVVLLNHHQVRIFHATVPAAAEQLTPPAPAEYFRHLARPKDFSRGQEKPDPNSFFPPVAHALKAASQILLCGSGTGKSNELEQFTAWLNTHHPELARRIVGSLTVDEHHLTDDQLLTKARDFYATPRPRPVGQA